MKNPYYTSKGQTHPISVDEMQRLCFEIVNVVAASSELASEQGADIRTNGLILQLHREYAENELCKKLLQLSVLVRTFDDIAAGSQKSDEYREHAKRTSGTDEIGHLSVDGTGRDFNLREACNKIIHAQEIRAVYDDVVEFAGDEIVSRRWFCDGEIELKGVQSSKEWEASIYVYEFIETVLERIQFKF